MQKLTIICVLVLSFSNVFAQKCDISVRGKITDSEDSTPISYATLQIIELNKSKSTTTNFDGDYIFERLCENVSNTIEIRHISYHS